MKTKTLLTLLLLFVCLSNYAQTAFQKPYGDSMNQVGYAVKQCYDGGYIATGFTSPFSGAYNVYLVRTNASGDTLWTRSFGGDQMVGFDVIQTADSNFVLSGYKGSGGNFLLKKVDASGNSLWTKTLGAGWGQAVQETFNGELIIAGDRLKKTDANGNLIWTKYPGGGQLMYIIQSADSNYVMSGFGGGNISLIKTDTAGTTLWTKTFPGYLINASNNNIAQTTDGGYILAGMNSSGGLLIKTDMNGDTLWTKVYPSFDAYAVVQTSDGGYAIAGSTLFQMLLLKTDAMGIIESVNTYGGSGDEYAKSLQQTSDNGFILTGGTTSFPGLSNLFLVKTDTLLNNVGLHELTASTEMLVYPNPFSSAATISLGTAIQHAQLIIYNAFGEEVKTFSDLSSKELRINKDNLPNGIYFIRLIRNNKVMGVQKLIIVD